LERLNTEAHKRFCSSEVYEQGPLSADRDEV